MDEPLVLTADRVDVRPAFAEAPGLLLGRTAASSASFEPNHDAGEARLITGAACGVREMDVRVRALGELVERVGAFEGGRHAGNLRFASYAGLCAAGERALSPRQLQQFAPGQPLPPGLEDDADSATLAWRLGLDLLTSEPVWAPAQASYLGWRPRQGEPLVLRPSATGLAAGADRPSAEARALLEVVERAACITAWRDPEAAILAEADEVAPAAYLPFCAALGLRLDLYAVPTPGLPDTVLALTCAEDGAGATIGSACHPDPKRAAEKAVQETLMLQRTMRGVSPREVSPERPRTSLDHVARAYAMGAVTRDWFRQRARRGSPRRPAVADGSHRSLVEGAARAWGGPVVAVDVADPSVAAMGWSVVRVIVPQAPQKESSSLVPHLGAFTGPGRAGGANDRRLNLAPHPFG